MRTFDYQYYAVACLDVMGQRQKLRALTFPPESPAEHDANIHILQDTLGVIRRIRKGFEAVIRMQKRVTLEDPRVVPASMRSIAQFDMQVSSLGVSDSFFLWVPLGTPPQFTPRIMALYLLVLGAGLRVLASLYEEVPVRGCVDIGIGIQHERNEIYGPVLEQVYELESKVADYPRIVLGRGFIDGLRDLQETPGDSPDLNIARRLMSRTSSLIGVDLDGRPIVDYLSESFLKTWGGQSHAAQWVPKAYQFALREERRFIEAPDDYRASKYSRLLAYFQSRLGYSIRQGVGDDV